MNKADRKLLLEIQQLSNMVPGIKNQMDTGAATSQRYDLMEQAHLTSKALLNLINLSVAEEEWEKEEFKEELKQSIESLREFKRLRDSEGWDKGSQYIYNVRLGSW
ncbi:hypothetical protein D3C74_91820 [compost metagenome]